MRALAFSFAIVLAATGCKGTPDQSFCTTYKTEYIKRCADGCITQQGNTSSARPACEQQCERVLPLDPNFAARCLPPGFAATAAPSASAPK